MLVYVRPHHDGLWHGWDMEELFWGGAHLPHLPARVLRSHPAALQAQFLPGLHQRGLGQRLFTGPLPWVQSCLHAEAQPGEEPQTVQHSREVQRPECGEGHHSGTAVHPVPPRPAAPCSESLPALQCPVLPVPRPDTPAAAVLSPGAPVGGGGGGEGLDLPSARWVQALPLRGRTDSGVSVLLLRPVPPQPWPRSHWCGAAAQWHQSKKTLILYTHIKQAHTCSCTSTFCLGCSRTLALWQQQKHIVWLCQRLIMKADVRDLASGAEMMSTNHFLSKNGKKFSVSSFSDLNVFRFSYSSMSVKSISLGSQLLVNTKQEILRCSGKLRISFAVKNKSFNWERNQ